MCALFTGLHDVAQVLTEHIREETGVADVQAGPPRDAGSQTEPGARITLLYLSPQPSHINDPVAAQSNGSTRPAPLSLSCHYLITVSGADADDPIAAHHTLGQILNLIHDRPSLILPLSQAPASPPGVFSDLGDGPLHLVQVPMSLDQIDKIWTPFQMPLQPWALIEVWPVQLVSQLPDDAAAPPVRPGGIGLTVRAVRAAARPVISRITPGQVRPGGRIRIEAALPGPLDGAAVDGVLVASGDPGLTEEEQGKVTLLALAQAGLEELGTGSHTLTMRSSGLISAVSALRIAAADAAAVDALPVTVHDPAMALTLTGSNLGSAEEALFWPDGGLTSPGDVHTLALGAVSDTQVTVAAADLAALAAATAGRGPWRCSLRIAGTVDHEPGSPQTTVFTPFVVLELGS